MRNAARKIMRSRILALLKNFYPAYCGYNGGNLAPARERDPDLFMSVLTELEGERVIEYNETEIFLRLSKAGR